MPNIQNLHIFRLILHIGGFLLDAEITGFYIALPIILFCSDYVVTRNGDIFYYSTILLLACEK